VHWTPVVAGALVASALSLVLIAFGGSLGLSVASTAPTWRDTSPILALLSGLYLVLTALVSFGFAGYVAGRLRTTWDPGLHSEFVEFRDGTHGLLSWALAVVISGLVAAVIATAISSKSAAPATTPVTYTGEALIAGAWRSFIFAGQSARAAPHRDRSPVRGRNANQAPPP
jgi:hypothetical protein